jgi:acetylxylan esterase
MPSPSTILRTALVAGVASAASIERRQMVTDSCAEVHIFLAKGNNEPYPGRMGAVVSAVCEGLESCDYEDIQMNNMRADPYCSGVSEGTENGRAQIIAYNARCPDSKLVLSGFSQGGHVVGDIVSGGGGSFFQNCQTTATPALAFNTPAGQAIAAIVTFGDVRHTANQPYNYLAGATKFGLFPRNSQQLASGIQYTNVWRDYCNGEDSVCARGSSSAEHLDYFERYTPEVAEYIHEKLREAGLGSSPSTTSALPVGPSTTGSAGSAPYPTVSVPHGGNSTASQSQTVITVTDETRTLTYYTTVCPITDVYVPNPTAEVPPATLPPVTETELPEATHPVPSDASSTPIIGTATIPGVVVPTHSAPSNGTVPPAPTTSLPAGSGSAANVAQIAGVFGAAVVAVAALL